MSLRSSILDNIASTLAAITVAGGYELACGEAKRGFKHFNNVPEDLLRSGYFAAYVAGADEKRVNSAQRYYTSDMDASVVVYVKTATSTDLETLERDLDKAISDVTEALMVDVSRGGYAVTTELVEVNTDKGSFAPYASAEIIVRTQYRASVSAP